MKKSVILVFGIIFIVIGSSLAIYLIGSSDSGRTGGGEGETTTTYSVTTTTWNEIIGEGNLKHGEITMGSYHGRSDVMQLISRYLLDKYPADAKTAFYFGFTSGTLKIDLFFTLNKVLTKVHLLEGSTKVISFEQTKTYQLETWLTLEVNFDCEKGTYSMKLGGISIKDNTGFSATKIDGILVEIPYHMHFEGVFPLIIVIDNYLYVDFISAKGTVG